MSNNEKILFIVLIVAVLVLSVPFSCLLKEHFGTYSSKYKQYCSSCDGLDSYACDKCYNCGRSAEKNGYTKCVPGDSRGPYYDNNTYYWTYNDPTYYYPQTHRFPEILTRSLYPYKKLY